MSPQCLCPLWELTISLGCTRFTEFCGNSCVPWLMFSWHYNGMEEVFILPLLCYEKINARMNRLKVWQIERTLLNRWISWPFESETGVCSVCWILAVLYRAGVYCNGMRTSIKACMEKNRQIEDTPGFSAVYDFISNILTHANEVARR